MYPDHSQELNCSKGLCIAKYTQSKFKRCLLGTADFLNSHVESGMLKGYIFDLLFSNHLVFSRKMFLEYPIAHDRAHLKHSALSDEFWDFGPSMVPDFFNVLKAVWINIRGPWILPSRDRHRCRLNGDVGGIN